MPFILKGTAMFFKKEKRQTPLNKPKSDMSDTGSYETKKENNIHKASEHKRKKERVIFDLGGRTVSVIFIISLILIFFLWVLNHTATLTGFFAAVISLFSPVIIGAALAFLINVPLRAAETLYETVFSKAKGTLHKRIKRPLCLTLSILIILGLLFALVFMVLPGFTSSFKIIMNSVPKYVEKVEGWWDNIVLFAKEFGAVLPDLSFDTQKIMDTLTGFAGNIFGSVFGAGEAIVSQTVSFTASVFSFIANFIISFVFAIYILAQKEKLTRNIKSTLFAFLPEKRVLRILDVARLTNKTFFSFATGQLTEAIIIGILCFIGMKIFSIPHASVVSVIIGITALIPVFGAYVGTILGAFLILLVSPFKAFWFVVFIIVLQQFESNLIYPHVVGDSVGLPGIWVIVCVVVGGDLFGVSGMLLSVPVCAVLYALLRQEVYKRLAEKKEAKTKNEPA
ncbi:MAG: AI-2E family transporter [Ruminococcaceae bacterium]|nr:AI-2E family transporter [Oscillospiraceae bacterium]